MISVEEFRQLVRDTGFGAYVLFGAALALLVLVSSVFYALVGFYWAIIGYEIVAILGAGFYWRAIVGREVAAPWPELDDSGMSVGSAVLLALTAVVLGLWGNAVMGLGVDLFPDTLGPYAEQYQARIRELLLESEGLNWWLATVGVALVAPVCEEALFRGSILQEQLKDGRRWRIVAANGLLFGAFHVQPLNLVPLAVIGAFLAHVTIVSRSLWPAILGHTVLNVFNGVVMPAVLGRSLERSSGTLPPEASAMARLLNGEQGTPLEFAAWALVLGVVSVALWYAVVRLLDNLHDESKVS